MARFNATGIQGLALSMTEFAAIPDDVVEEMLDAAARVVVRYHKAEIRSLGLVRSGKLAGSIEAHKKAGSARNDFKRYVLVYPTGRHHIYQSRVVTKTYKRSKSGRTYTTGGGTKVATNGEVGFVQEYGVPRRKYKGTGWMSRANDEASEEMTNAEFAVYDRWLKSLNL